MHISFVHDLCQELIRFTANSGNFICCPLCLADHQLENTYIVLSLIFLASPSTTLMPHETAPLSQMTKVSSWPPLHPCSRHTDYVSFAFSNVFSSSFLSSSFPRLP